MASVTLTELWVHLDSDPSRFVRAPLSALSEQRPAPAEAREYAGGVVKIIRRPTRRRSFTARLEVLPRADADQLAEWTGETVIVRDPRGRLLKGFISVSIDELPGPNNVVNLSLAFEATGPGFEAV